MKNFHLSLNLLTEPVDPKDVLDKEKALQALAALRHAKWFQVRFLLNFHLLRLLYIFISWYISSFFYGNEL